MSDDALRRQADIARLNADLRAAKVELLSAQCATDRLRLQYRLQDIVSFGERQSLERTIDSVRSLYRFFSRSRPKCVRKSRGTVLPSSFLMLPLLNSFTDCCQRSTSPPE